MPYWNRYSSYYPPYVPVAKRRANAAKELKKLEKQTGRKPIPITIDGRKIAATFWGKAWCDHLESFADFASRLPRGRTYVRNGSVVDLQISPGAIEARVAGSELYTVTISIKQTQPDTWSAIKSACAGQISSLIDLLKGKLADGVMRIIADQNGGLFPLPREIDFDCSCPDSASMCKHIAAVLYGIGARLDTSPELLFLLRKVDHLELIQSAAPIPTTTPADNTIAESDVSAIFGIDLDTQPQTAPPLPSAAPTPARTASPTKPAARPTTPPKSKPKKKAKVAAKKTLRIKRTRSNKTKPPTSHLTT